MIPLAYLIVMDTLSVVMFATCCATGHPWFALAAAAGGVNLHRVLAASAKHDRP